MEERQRQELMFGASRSQCYLTLQFFLDNGNEDDVNIQGNNGITLLHIACMNGYTNIIELLLSYPKININIQNNGGDSPLILACYKGNIENVKLLLARDNINVHLKDTHNCTPLLQACEQGHFQVAKLLLDYYPSTSINAPELNGKTPLYWACWFLDIEMIKDLLKRIYMSGDPLFPFHSIYVTDIAVYDNLMRIQLIVTLLSSKRFNCIDSKWPFASLPYDLVFDLCQKYLFIP